MGNTLEELADFASGGGRGALPQSALSAAELAVLDTIAAALGGVGTRNAAVSRDAAQEVFGEGDSPVWFAPVRLRKPGAVFANCAAASALDVDDGHRGASGHPGAAIVPAVLAEARQSGAGGLEILTAVAVGYDVALRIASARRQAAAISYASGRWTGYGVAAAIGSLRRLPADLVAQAMAIAGAEAPQNLPQGDSRTVSSVKGSNPWSTVTAIAAVARAERGATGPVDMLDRAQVYDVPAITDELATRWFIKETYLKPYACCRYTHPALDAVFALTQGRALAGSSIERLVVEIFPEARKIANETAPQTLEGAQFSLPFTIALAALRGPSVLRPLAEPSLRDQEVLALSRRIEVIYADDFAGAFPKQTPARVSLFSAGEKQSKTVMHPWGDPANPMDRPSVARKLRDLGKGVLDDEAVDRLITVVSALKGGDARSLLCVLSQPTGLPVDAGPEPSVLT
ncbi:MmgE/PrpD family protein [Pelagibius litoralis]|uniref:MmgE/PrpD family protein n=1 Tax=Pelagibius litoralis TaxID=374515 RepID=A0A967EWQ7_9PROT|nr:MmgE/PrpD family protein [Pelagibius litoralis]NIA67863.1 MmgE/PrpD family protein [Pelagibius litoralis]